MERHYYSVPYALVHQEVDVHLTAETVEVLHRGVRVASHVRSYEPGKRPPLTEHMPKAHQKYLGRTPSRLIEDAQQIGPCTGATGGSDSGGQAPSGDGLSVVPGDSAAWRRPIRPSAWKRPPGAACGLRAYNFQSMDSILKNQLDRLPAARRSARPAAVDHDNIRGADYFDSPPETDPPVIQ